MRLGLTGTIILYSDFGLFLGFYRTLQISKSTMFLYGR
jgi:hypothetical protein